MTQTLIHNQWVSSQWCYVQPALDAALPLKRGEVAVELPNGDVIAVYAFALSRKPEPGFQQWTGVGVFGA